MMLSLSGKPLKLVNQFLYLSSNISSTENSVTICIGKAWNTIDRLSIIWKYDCSDKKIGFLPSCDCVSTIVEMHHLVSNEMHGEKARRELHKDTMGCYKQILEATPFKTAVLQSLTFNLQNHPKRTKYAGRCKRNKDDLISNVLQWNPTHGHTSVGQPAESYIHLFCADFWILFRKHTESDGS